jgi:hypothetical protein
LTPGPSYIRIIGVPPGEAPLWVREKWVGLELPLAWGRRVSRKWPTAGVLSGPRNVFTIIWWGLLGRIERESGYAVDVLAAVNILERTAPEAASWWRNNAPHLQKPWRKFVFQDFVCEVLD